MSYGQRSHNRVPGDATVAVEHLGPDGSLLPDTEEELCMLANISEGGVGFQSTHPPALDSKVNISIGVSDGFIVGEAEVKYVNEADENGSCEVGAEFLYLSAESLKYVRRLVEHRRTSGLG